MLFSREFGVLECVAVAECVKKCYRMLQLLGVLQGVALYASYSLLQRVAVAALLKRETAVRKKEESPV